PRARRKGCRSAWMSGIHHGEACGIGAYTSAAEIRAPNFDCAHLAKILAPRRRISMLRTIIPAAEAQSTARFTPRLFTARLFTDRGIVTVKVIASSLRKRNIVDLDGKLYVILTAESIHPGKGTPVTQLDMRRLSDGVKSSLRFKTTDQVERAHVEEREFQF